MRVVPMRYVGIGDTAQHTHAHNLVGRVCSPRRRRRVAAHAGHALGKRARRDAGGQHLHAAHRPPPYHVPKLRGALVPQSVQYLHLGCELAQLRKEEPMALAQDDER